MYTERTRPVKSFLFELIGRACVSYAGFSDWLFGRMAAALLDSSVWVKMRVASVAMALLVLVDRERVEAEKQEIVDWKERNELNLMQAAVKLKEHALEFGSWTEDHTQAINDVGFALVDECDWEEDRAQEYLGSIIESMPGLDWRTEE